MQSIMYNILNDYGKYKDEVASKFRVEESFKEFLNLVTKIVSNKVLGVDLDSNSIDKVKTYKDFTDKITTAEERRDILKDLLNKILGDKRLILVIDELDRCNPDFATKLLETVKHFYDFDNVTILIAANNEELKNVLNKKFGERFDSYSYLNKIYDFVITVDSNRSIEYCEKQLKFLIEGNITTCVLMILIKYYRMTLRECNKYKTLYDTVRKVIMQELKISYFDIKRGEITIVQSIILPIILVFKLKDIEAFNATLNENTEYVEKALRIVQEELNKDEINESWLKEFVENNNIFNSEDTKQIIDDKVIEYYLKTYENIFENIDIKKVFLSLIKSTL